MTRGRHALEAGRVALTAMLLALLGVEMVMGFLPGSQLSRAWFHDATTYLDAGARWVSGQGFYLPYQLAGPYDVVEREVLYPPPTAIVFALFSYARPLFVLLPIAVTAWIVWTNRPRPWAWVGILLCLTLPIRYSTGFTLEAFANGNPILWAMMFTALATRWPGFAPFAWFKPVPTVVPFGLYGIRTRGWWLGLGVLAAVSVAFLPMWFDYLTALRNARTDFPALTYGVLYAVPMLIPLISRGRSATRSS